MTSVDISIIVAAYNAEKTLAKCLDSILAQTKPEFEVILVDDGSTDNTGAICDEYSRKDKRIRTFHNQNQGIGTTRQFGLDHALGQYVIHVDSDDWIEPNMMQMLFDEAISGDYDMVICDVVKNFGKYSVILHQKPTSFDSETVLMEMLLRKIHGGPWNKLIKRECILRNNVSYLAGQNFGEDVLFNAELLNKGISVSYVQQALYHYEAATNSNSASQIANRNSLLQRERMAEYLRTNFEKPQLECIHDYYRVMIAFFAIRNNIYCKGDFYSKYNYLFSLKWSNYPKQIPFSYRLIVWSAFNLSYEIGRILYLLKSYYRKVIDSLIGI